MEQPLLFQGDGDLHGLDQLCQIMAVSLPFLEQVFHRHGAFSRDPNRLREVLKCVAHMEKIDPLKVTYYPKALKRGHQTVAHEELKVFFSVARYGSSQP